MTTGELPRRALADAVRGRQEHLGLTTHEIALRGGLDVDDVRAIEGKAADQVSMETLRGLDLALSWRDGTAEAVLEDRIDVDTATVAPTEDASGGHNYRDSDEGSGRQADELSAEEADAHLREQLVRYDHEDFDLS